jgi:hypothetical protein
MNANLVATGLFVFIYAIGYENKYVCPELDETFNWKLKTEGILLSKAITGWDAIYCQRCFLG